MTSIKDFLGKIKLSFNTLRDSLYSEEKGLKIKDDLYIVIMIILVGTASFGLGKISALEKTKTPISILKTKENMLSATFASDTSTSESQVDGEVLASRSGTKYYYPWCTGVSKIKEENKIWFDSIEEARAKGLTPASNCAGLK